MTISNNVLTEQDEKTNEQWHSGDFSASNAREIRHIRMERSTQQRYILHPLFLNKNVESAKFIPEQVGDYIETNPEAVVRILPFLCDKRDYSLYATAHDVEPLSKEMHPDGSDFDATQYMGKNQTYNYTPFCENQLVYSTIALPVPPMGATDAAIAALEKATILGLLQSSTDRLLEFKNLVVPTLAKPKANIVNPFELKYIGDFPPGLSIDLPALDVESSDVDANGFIFEYVQNDDYYIVDLSKYTLQVNIPKETENKDVTKLGLGSKNAQTLMIQLRLSGTLTLTYNEFGFAETVYTNSAGNTPTYGNTFHILQAYDPADTGAEPGEGNSERFGNLIYPHKKDDRNNAYTDLSLPGNIMTNFTILMPIQRYARRTPMPQTYNPLLQQFEVNFPAYTNAESNAAKGVLAETRGSNRVIHSLARHIASESQGMFEYDLDQLHGYRNGRILPYWTVKTTGLTVKDKIYKLSGYYFEPASDLADKIQTIMAGGSNVHENEPFYMFTEFEYNVKKTPDWSQTANIVSTEAPHSYLICFLKKNIKYFDVNNGLAVVRYYYIDRDSWKIPVEDPATAVGKISWTRLIRTDDDLDTIVTGTNATTGDVDYAHHPLFVPNTSLFSQGFELPVNPATEAEQLKRPSGVHANRVSAAFPVEDQYFNAPLHANNDYYLEYSTPLADGSGPDRTKPDKDGSGNILYHPRPPFPQSQDVAYAGILDSEHVITTSTWTDSSHPLFRDGNPVNLAGNVYLMDVDMIVDQFTMPIPIINGLRTEHELTEPFLGLYGYSKFNPIILPNKSDLSPLFQNYKYKIEAKRIARTLQEVESDAGAETRLTIGSNHILDVQTELTFSQDDKELLKIDEPYPKFQIFRARTATTSTSIEVRTECGKPDYILFQVDSCFDSNTDQYSNTGHYIEKITAHIHGQPINTINRASVNRLRQYSKQNSHPFAEQDYKRGLFLSRKNFEDFDTYLGDDYKNTFEMDLWVEFEEGIGDIPPEYELQVIFLYVNKYRIKGDNNIINYRMGMISEIQE